MRTVGVKLTVDYSGYQSGLQKASLATKQFTGEMDKAAKAGKLDKVADQATKFGLAGVAAFGLVVKSAADFDKQMSAVSAATHANASDMDALRKAALQAGKDTMFSATQAAQGITELSKAGVSTADVLGGGLKGALDLAAAGQLSVAEAAETTASALTQFKLTGKDVPHVADLLAAAAGKAQGSVHDMGYALNQSGLVAAQFGLSIEDTTGMLAEFANAGLIGSDAGTSFKTMLLAIANPSKVTSHQMQALNIDFYDAQGRFIGLAGVAKVLQDRLGGLSQQQRQQAMAQIFGNDAVRAASVLYADGAKGVETWKNKVNDAGYAAGTAADLTNNLAGDIERLKGSFETLSIEAGSGANGGLRLLTKGLNGVVNQALSLPPAIGSAVTVLVGVVGATGLALAGFIKLRAGVAKASEELTAMGPAGEKAAGMLKDTASAAGKTALAFAALEASATIFNSLDKDSVNVDKLSKSLINLASTGNSAGELNDQFGKNFDNLGKIAGYAESADHGWGHFMKTVAGFVPIAGDAGMALGNLGLRLTEGTDFDSAKASMAGMDAALVNTMNTTNDVAMANDLWRQALSKSGLGTEQLAALLPDTYKKLGEMNTAADQGATSVNNLGKASTGTKGKIAAVGAAASNAADDMEAMEKAVESLISAQLGLDRADIAARDGLVNLKKELKDGTKTLSLNSVEGRKNRSAVLDQISAIDELRQSRIKQGVTLDEADKKYIKDIDGLRKTMLQAGYSKKAVDELLGSYKKLPDDITTDLSVTGAAAVSKKLTGLLIMQEALKKGVPAAAIAATNKNVAQGFAMGGWTGPGSKYAPAGIVHADEFVIQKDSRQKIEKQAPGLLDRMNTTGMVPGYAGGGLVAPFPVNASVTKIPSTADVIAAVGAFSGPAPTGALAAWIRTAESLTGTPSSWSGPLNVLIKRESGGNPRAINLTDSNAKAGHPSKGLMQTIPSTFEHYRLHSLPDDIYNPVANIVAGIRYIKSRYGSIFHVQQANPNLPPKGYAMGGLVAPHYAMAGGGVIGEPVYGIGASGASYSFGEGGRKETVMPGIWQSAAASAGGTTVVNHYTVGAPVINVNGSSQSPDQIATAVSRQLGRQIDLALRS